MLLHKAVRENNIDEVKSLLNEGANVNAKDKRGNTVLHIVHDKEIATLLLGSSSFSDLNIQNDNGDAPVHMWSMLPLECIRNLNKDTFCLRREILEMFLEAGASPNIQNHLGYGVLHSVFVYGGIAGCGIDIIIIRDMVTMLLKYNANVNLADFESCIPLHHVVREPHMESIAELLLLAGANVNAKDCRGMTPLHHLFDLDNEDMVKLLLYHGGNLNEKDINGTTLLSSAALVGNEFMVKLLLNDLRIDINLGDLNGITPLHLAAAYKRIGISELLVAHDANINALDARNATPFHYAAYGGTPEIVSLMSQANANHRLKDDLNYRPIQYALDRHYFYTALAFGEDYQREVKVHLSTTDETTELEDQILQSFPADDVLTMIIPSSKVYSNPYDLDILPPDTIEYIRIKTNENSSAFVQGMTEVPGIGKMPDIEEVKEIRIAVERYIGKLTSVMAEIDPRFRGAILCSGSVYEGTKICDPYEFDYMLCLEAFQQICAIELDENTEFDNVQVSKVKSFEAHQFEEFFDDNQLQSNKVMMRFVQVARKAMCLLNFSTGSPILYLQSLTEHTLVEATWIFPGTVTCNFKFIWNGLYYKQLVICVDLVPAIHLSDWPQAARKESLLLTESIISKGCHVVSKSGYWRLSFSLAEKMILENLSNKEKLAFIGAKVMLHAAVSAKVTIYDDSVLGDVSNVGDQGYTRKEYLDATDNVKQEFSITGEASSFPLKVKSLEEPLMHKYESEASGDECKAAVSLAPSFQGMMVDKLTVPCGTPGTVANVSHHQPMPTFEVGDRLDATYSEDKSAGVVKDISGIDSDKGDNRAGEVLTTTLLDPIVSGTLIGKFITPCSTPITVIKVSDEQAMLSLSVDDIVDATVNKGQSADTFSESDKEGSDVPAKTIEPRDVLSTYLLKMLFFHCLEENLSNPPGPIVTTKQMFQHLYFCLKEKLPLPYYFMQSHDLIAKLLESEDLCETEFIVMMLNTILSQIP